MENKFTSARPFPKKIKLFIKDFFSKCDQIRRKLRIWSYLLKKTLMENFIFCAVPVFTTEVSQISSMFLSLKA